MNFGGIQAKPQPVQQPLPIVIGGHTKAAYERAVRHAHGWYGFALDVAATERCLAGLHEAAQTVERPPALGPLEISITPAARLTPELVDSYAAIGVQRLIPFPRMKTAEELLDFVEETGRLLATVG